ncbi:MAG: flavin reductase [Clostridiales bacterium]|nr:flavin reductase [Clostridiales bacterium]
MSFKETNIREIKESAVKMISDDWALVTAGDNKKFNTMTVSWGGLGELWGRDVAFIFIRPQRYTLEFINREDFFTLSFFGGKYKKELAFCGSKSGRDVDKAAATGLTPASYGDAVFFDEAETVLVCKKIAVFDILPDGFLDRSIDDNYKNGDYHKVFVGEIVKTLQK